MIYKAILRDRYGLNRMIDGTSEEERLQWFGNLMNQNPTDGRGIEAWTIHVWYNIEEQ